MTVNGLSSRAWNVAGRQMGYGDLGYENMCHTIGFNVVRRQEYFLKNMDRIFPLKSLKRGTERPMQPM